ncbi:MAG: glycosyltransferase family 9 protein [Verrucomicrobiota bacterium]
MNPVAGEQPLKPKMLVLELWGLGDLAIATPFLQSASEKFQVTLLAKPHALELQPEFWPGVKVIPFTAPWTPFRKKYRLLSWPWKKLFRLVRDLRDEHFDLALSARWDPRDHVILNLAGAKQQWGFPRVGSHFFLSRAFRRPEGTAHRFPSWKKIAQELGLVLQLPKNAVASSGIILVHTGASHVAKVWPLDRFHRLVEKLRQLNHAVRVLCDPSQRESWIRHGEKEIVVPSSVSELLLELKRGGLFIGNDSGSGHLAALCGLPTFTIFGSQFAEAFLPLHPQADFLEGKPCPYKPCHESCRFPAPYCLTDLTDTEVWEKVESFVKKHCSKQAAPEILSRP